MIINVDIKGYKSVKSLNLDLGPINILIGGNGVGKSNFISIFSLIRALYEGHLQEYVIRKGGPDALLYMGRKTTNHITISLTFRNDSEQNKFSVVLSEANGEMIIDKVSTAYLCGDDWKGHMYEGNKKESDFRNIHYSQAFFVNNLLKDFEVFHFHDTGDKSPIKGFSNIDDNFALRRDGSNLAAYLYFLKCKHPNHFKRIEKMVASVSPFFESFVLEPDRINESLIRLEWRHKGGLSDSYFNEYQLSDGTLRFICLATLLMQPVPPSTIVIDEPELGLHPLAINKLSAMIRNASAKSQIIVSTQSVTFINEFDPSEVIVADYTNSGTVFNKLDGEFLKNGFFNCR